MEPFGEVVLKNRILDAMFQLRIQCGPESNHLYIDARDGCPRANEELSPCQVVMVPLTQMFVKLQDDGSPGLQVSVEVKEGCPCRGP